jgi:hypothetical protein
MTHPISRFPVPDLQDLPDDIRMRILATQEKLSIRPNDAFFTLGRQI